MTLHVKLKMWVTGKRSERDDVVRMREQIIRDRLDKIESWTDMDLSNWKDFCALLRDLNQLMDRARARTKKRGT